MIGAPGRWSKDSIIRLGLAAEMIAHPCFPRAARTRAINMLRVSANDRALDGLFRDWGRSAAALSLIYVRYPGHAEMQPLRAQGASARYAPPRASPSAPNGFDPIRRFGGDVVPRRPGVRGGEQA